MHQRRTKRRIRTKKRTRKRTQRGGTKIAKPPLPCVGNVNIPYRSNAYIGKITPHSYEHLILKIKEYLASVDPTEAYIIPPILHCELASPSKNSRFQEIQKYGGVSLYDRLQKGGESLADILLPLEPFLQHLAEFNKRFLHRDLHTGNIVWDGSVYKMIDFETM
jgi:hypothetical protein